MIRPPSQKGQGDINTIALTSITTYVRSPRRKFAIQNSTSLPLLLGDLGLHGRRKVLRTAAGTWLYKYDGF